MNEIVPFNYDDRQIRTVMIDGEPWFVAVDVCAALGISSARQAVSQLDDDEVCSTYVTDHLGRDQQTFVINEAGLYSLIMRSRKPDAKQFKRWVTHDVLPAIRRSGSYSVPEPRAELSPREMAMLIIKEADRADAAESKVEELRPSADSWDNLATANGDLAVADAAKVLSRDPNIQVGRDRLFTVLREIGWVYRQPGDQRHRCYQHAIDTGRLSQLPASHYHPRTGELVLDPPQVRITVKGLSWLRKHLGGSSDEPGPDGQLRLVGG